MPPHSNDPSGTKLNVLVTVEEDAKDRLDAIAAKLRGAGMKVVDVMELGCVISGEVSDKDMAKLRKVPGVSGLEIDSMFTAD